MTTILAAIVLGVAIAVGVATVVGTRPSRRVQRPRACPPIPARPSAAPDRLRLTPAELLLCDLRESGYTEQRARFER